MLLSLILCSRNDSYMGNSRWRLETSINLSLINAKEANFLDKLEIIVSDWGSEVPLSEALNLIPEAKGKVKFVYVPPDVAKVMQKDSKFPEVIALNAAARRADGEYIGRIDNDTVVGAGFFRNFNKLYQNNPSQGVDLSNSFLFVERKSVPYRISCLSLPLSFISFFIKSTASVLKLESAKEWGREFWWSPVGIMMFHKDIWNSTRGYDERLIYWGWMEGDLALRLGQKHRVVEFSKYVGHDFYHLEHYSNLVEYKDRNGTATTRKKNPVVTTNLQYKANNPNWGLSDYDIKSRKFLSKASVPTSSSMTLSFIQMLTGSCFLLYDISVSVLNKIKDQYFAPLRVLIGKIFQRVLP